MILPGHRLQRPEPGPGEAHGRHLRRGAVTWVGTALTETCKVVDMNHAVVICFVVILTIGLVLMNISC